MSKILGNMFNYKFFNKVAKKQLTESVEKQQRVEFQDGDDLTFTKSKSTQTHRFEKFS